MSYKIELQSNNTELQEILNTINALPEAGSGGESFEPSPFSQILTGTFTPASNTKDFTIPEDAVGTVGFLIIFSMNPNPMYLVQLAYINLGVYDYTERVIYKQVSYFAGTLSNNVDYPTVSADGRTFSNTKQSMYYSGATYGYAIGMINE